MSQSDLKQAVKSADALRALFCVNWAVDYVDKPDPTRFSPDYCVPGQPYWFFNHLQQNVNVDVLDCRSWLGVQNLERRFVRSYPSKSSLAWLRSPQYDLILSHGAQMGLGIALLQTLFPRRSSPPHVMFDVGAISGGAQGWKNPILINALRFAFRSLAGVICHSSHQLKFYEKEYPEVARVAQFIPLGVDTDTFHPVDTAVQDEMICVGYALRDWDLLIRAYARLNTSTRLILLGTSAKTYAATHGVECVPRVNIEEMRRRVSRARFVVLPLPRIDFCIGQQTFLQSMALAKTVLVSDIPAALDYIVDGETGFFYKAGDEQSLYRQLHFLLSEDSTVERVGQAARQATLTHFSESLMADRIVNYLRTVTLRNPRYVRKGLS